MVNGQNILISNCFGTENMIADYYTKPLLGKLFEKFCGKIMNS